MLEIRFHGRGGQGTVVASILLAKAFFKSGYYVQSFPLFGVERRGAPVEAFLRADRHKITRRTNVYEPDHVVVLDDTLIHAIDVTRGIKNGGWIVINSRTPPRDRFRTKNYKTAYVDATHIAIKHGLGTRTHPIVNTAMLGALARVLQMPPLEAIIETIKESVRDKTQKNIDASKEAFNKVVMQKANLSEHDTGESLSACIT